MQPMGKCPLNSSRPPPSARIIAELQLTRQAFNMYFIPLKPGTGLVYLVLAVASKLLIAAACRNLTFGTRPLVS